MLEAHPQQTLTLKHNICYRLYKTRKLSIEYRGKKCKDHFDNPENIEEDFDYLIQSVKRAQQDPAVLVDSGYFIITGYYKGTSSS